MSKINSILKIKDYDEKYEKIEDLREDYPKNQYVYFEIAYLADENSNYKNAVKYYTKAIKINSNYAYAYNNRGLAYKNLKEYDKAIENYDKALNINPKYAKAYNNRGNAYYYRKKYDKAIIDYDKAIQLNPNYAAAYSNRGNAYSDSEGL